MRLRPFTCGWLSISARYLFAGTGREEVVPASVGFFVIEHPEGLILFDTGCAPETARVGAAHWGEAAARDYPIEVGEDEIADRRLAACGLDPRQVRVIVLSHLHFDHAGAVACFPNARFVVAAQELADAREPLPGFDAGYYHAPDIAPVLAEGADVRALEAGDHDVTADGRVRAIATPGHTRGHISLVIDLPRTGRIVLPGDACFHAEALEHELPPGDPLPAPAAWRASLDRIRHLVREGATPLWSHVPRATYASSPNAVPVYD